MRVTGPGYACNPELSSVMDAAILSGSLVTGGCDGFNLTASDTADTQLLQTLNPMTQFSVGTHQPGVMSVTFWDPTWADARYPFYAYRWSDLQGGQWLSTGQTWEHTNLVGRAGYFITTYYIKGSQPGGRYYRLCGYTWNGIYGDRHHVCAPYAWMN
jgi:hypothetical protein